MCEKLVFSFGRLFWVKRHKLYTLGRSSVAATCFATVEWQMPFGALLCWVVIFTQAAECLSRDLQQIEVIAFQFHKQFSWFGKAGVGKLPEEKKAQGCGEAWWRVRALHCKQNIVKQCIRSSVTRLPAFAGCAKNLTVLLIASGEERGRTFQVDKIHDLSLSRAKSCVPNKAVLWKIVRHESKQHGSWKALNIHIRWVLPNHCNSWSFFWSFALMPMLSGTDTHQRFRMCTKMMGSSNDERQWRRDTTRQTRAHTTRKTKATWVTQDDRPWSYDSEG